MPSRFSIPLGLGALLALSSASGCGSRPACVIDTDCPLGQYCSVDQHCEFVGEGNDAGTTPVDAARSDAGDAGPVDAARTDGAAADANADTGAAHDSGAPDGGCARVPGDYMLDSSPAACPTLIATITIAEGATGCSVVVSSREEAGFGGNMSSSGGSRFGGGLSIGTTSYPDCSLTFSAGALLIDCGGGCLLPATMTP
jgi:hypothetical protein